MTMGRGLLTFTIAVAFLVALVLLVGKPQPSSAQIRPGWNPCGCYCGFEPPYPPVLPDLYRIINDEPCTGIISADACRTGLSNLPSDQLTRVCDRVRAGARFRSFKDSCPVFEKYCEPPKKECPSGQQAYSGTISCDCDGNGSDETSQRFEACGPPSSFPATFTSKCQDWAKGDSAFSYGSTPAIQQAGREWLQKTYCPANDCHQKYAKCTGPLDTELQKCLTRGRLTGITARCQRARDDAQKQCDSAKAACLRNAGQSPGPRPQPAPTPTPANIPGAFLSTISSSAPIWPIFARCPLAETIADE